VELVTCAVVYHVFLWVIVFIIAYETKSKTSRGVDCHLIMVYKCTNYAGGFKASAV